MSMTRRDYERIAAAIKASGLTTGNRKVVGQALAVVFAADNPRFDVLRFMAACGVRS